MDLGSETVQLMFLALIALAVGGFALTALFPHFTGEAAAARRVAAVKDGGKAKKAGIAARLKQDSRDNRRKAIQDSLNELDDVRKSNKKRLTLRAQISQAGLDISERNFWIGSLVTGVVLAVASLFAGVPLFVTAAAGVVGFLGLPRWFLKFLRKRRQETFLHEFADAIDVMVRGLKAGLPVTDAMRVIAAETAPPCGPEFMEVVEGQRIGIPVDQGIERMFERMPLAEVNFLAIVMSIQAKTGGNLAEALNNLSKVLRDRKKMKQKIKSVSQEAKASAAIIGSLPFVITGGMAVLNPDYLAPLWETKTGHLMVGGSLLWMFTGILVMRKMINFNI